MNSDCYVDKLKAASDTSNGQLMDVGWMQPKEYFQQILTSRSVIYENIDKKGPLSKQVCGHCVSIVNSIVTFQDLCTAVQVMLHAKYITQIDMEEGENIKQEAPVLTANVNLESSEVTSKRIMCHSGEMIDFKHNGANRIYPGSQAHNEMGKVDYSLQEIPVLRTDIKVEEDEKQKNCGCYSPDMKVNFVHDCSVNKDVESNSSGAKEITSDINTMDTLPSVFPQSISPNDSVGEEFCGSFERSGSTLTELKVNTVMKYTYEECVTELTYKVNTDTVEKHVDDSIFSDSKCLGESHESEQLVSSQILNCIDTVSGSDDAERLSDQSESVVQNSRMCQEIIVKVATVHTHEPINRISVSVKKGEEISDVDLENDPLSVYPDEKLRRANKSFEGKKRYKNKDLEAKPDSILTCVGCEETFQVRSKLKEHCKTCDIYLIINKQQRSKSEKKSVKTYNTRCILCDIVFPSRYRLKQHEIQVHGGALRKVGVRDETKVFRCKECTTSFHTNEELTKHKEFPAYVCQHCGTKKCSLLRLIQHEKTHTHILKYPGPHQCRICNKILSTKGNLKAHEMEHAGIRKFVCELCGKAFPSNRGLQSHKISVHTDERPFVCTQCDSAFKFERNLKEHSRVHTGVKPFSCDECGKLFRHSSSLREHRMIHTKPFKCDFCDKRFQAQHNLAEHVGSHDAVSYQHL